MPASEATKSTSTRPCEAAASAKEAEALKASATADKATGGQLAVKVASLEASLVGSLPEIRSPRHRMPFNSACQILLATS